MIDSAMQTNGVGEVTSAVHSDNCPGYYIRLYRQNGLMALLQTIVSWFCVQTTLKYVYIFTWTNQTVSARTGFTSTRKLSFRLTLDITFHHKIKNLVRFKLVAYFNCIFLSCVKL